MKARISLSRFDTIQSAVNGETAKSEMSCMDVVTARSACVAAKSEDISGERCM